MDLNDAARRILRHHWLLILVLTLLGAAVPIALDRYGEDSYVASSRITFGDTRGIQEANALADTALGLATSSQVAEAAVADSGVALDPSEVADHMQVEPVGTSGILELTVTASEPEGAVSLANALAAEVVRTREEAIFAESERLLEQLEVALEEERLTVLENLAKVVRPQVVDVATAGTKVEELLPTRLALGALLGLILGVGIASTIEAFRPTLSGPSLPRWLGAPILGRLRSARRDPWLGDYLRLAAEAAGVRRIQLVSAGRGVDLAGLARSLDARVGDHCTVEPLDLGAPAPGHSVAGRPVAGAGVVVVCRPVIKARALAPVERYLQLTRAPLLGVITCKGRQRPLDVQPRETAEESRSTAATEPSAAVGR